MDRRFAQMGLVAGTLAVATAACEQNKPDLLGPPAGYDPVETKGLTLNKAGVDALTLTEGEAREAHIAGLKQGEAFRGQGQCQSGSYTGDMPVAEHGEYQLDCYAGTVLFDIELRYQLFTTADTGRPLKGGAYVDFTGRLVDLVYFESTNPRSITAKVVVGELERLKK